MHSVLLDLGSDGNFPIMALQVFIRASSHAAQPGGISGRVIKGVWRVQIRSPVNSHCILLLPKLSEGECPLDEPYGQLI